MKRIMYLHHILTRDDEALIKRAFRAQVEQPAKGDWAVVVAEDMDYIGLGHLSHDEIANTSKYSLRALVKQRIRMTAFKELLVEKEKSTKLRALKYTDLSLQPYLTVECKLNNKQKCALFRWRTHMVNVKQNWGMKDAVCPLCKKADDTQYHLLTCPVTAIPEPWNIQSVIEALRRREVLLEQEQNERPTQSTVT